jgi:hypothetical protein
LPIIFPYDFISGQVYDFFIFNDLCEVHKEIRIKCDNSSDCHIYDLIAEAHECNEEGKLYIDVAFKYNSEVSPTFKIFTNGIAFGPYEYGQTHYTIGPLMGDCSIDNVWIQDSEIANCKDVFEFDNPLCCEKCNLTVGDIIPICQNDKITALKIGTTNPNGGTDSVNITINGINYGNKAYTDSPFLINIPDQVPGIINFRFKDTKLQGCVKEIVKELKCGGEQECQLGELSVEFVECSENEFKFNINFYNQNTPSDSFFLWIKNDLYGPYAYGNQPIITPLYNKNEKPFRVRIEDSEKELCALQKIIEKVECTSATKEEASAKYTAFIYNGIVMLSANQNHDNLRVELSDILGRRIGTETMSIKEGINTTNLHVFESGIYFLNIIQESDLQSRCTKIAYTKK